MDISQASNGQEALAALRQGFIGDGIAGETRRLFHDSEVADMARLLDWQQKDDLQTAEMLLDLANTSASSG